MMLLKLPVLITEGTEISNLIKSVDLGFTVPIGNQNALFEMILKISSLESPVLDKYANKAYEYTKTFFNPNLTMNEFEKWINKPWKRNFENININKISKFVLIKRFFKSLKEKGILQTLTYTKRHFSKMFKG